MGRSGDRKVTNDKTVMLYKLSYLAVFVILKILFFVINNRDIQQPYDFTVRIDDLIPFNKYFVVPYVYWYFYLAFGIIFFVLKDYKKYFRLLAGIYTGESLALITYLFIPSTTQRPMIYDNDVFSKILEILYKSDSHLNCLPSMHIFETILISIFLLRYSSRIGMTVFVWISTISICLSTVFIKQHAVLDLFTAVILAFAVYYFVTCDKIFNNNKVKKVLHILIPDTVRHEHGYYRDKEKHDEVI